MLMRVTQRVKRQENDLEILGGGGGGGCAGAKQVSDGAGCTFMNGHVTCVFGCVV